MTPDKNVVGWFEIPVTDMDRAIKFYESVLDINLERHQLGHLDMAWFPNQGEANGAAGSLVCYGDFYQPSRDGVLIYFTSPTGDISNELSRVEKAGGSILKARTQVSEEYGFMALILDTEGNRIAVHSRA